MDLLKHFGRMSLVCLLAGAAVLSHGASRRGGDMTLEQIVNSSDDIVLGICKEKKAGFVNRHIETDYEIEVSEVLKGKSYGTSSTVTMSVMGGELKAPPITQYTQLQPVMYKGEEVALFLRTKPRDMSSLPDNVKRSIDTSSKLYRSPRVVGMDQGKFTVLTDPKSGGKRVARINSDRQGIMPEENILRRTLRLVAAREIPVTSGPAVQLTANTVTTPYGKEYLTESVGAVTAEKLEKGSSVTDTRLRSSLSGGIPAQDLEEFKSQVKQLAK